MEEMVNVFNSLAKAINKNVNDLSKISDLNQKKTQAEVIKMLCESMGVFLDAMGGFGDDDLDPGDEEEMPF
jgi:hypothetical protein